MSFAFTACTPTQHDHDKLDSDGDKIVGGFEVSAQSPEAAYVVMIYGEKESGESYLCTGTFISKTAILTAGHCVVEDVNKMSVFFGLKPFEVDSMPLTIEKTEVVPDYHAGALENRNDLAIITFSGGLPSGASIATLPSADVDIQNTSVVLAMGYGRTEGLADSETASREIGVLREALLSQRNITLSERSFILDQSNGHGVCFGDSGGPALAFSPDGKKALVVGIASAVVNDSDHKTENECASTSLYMRTSGYLPWLSGFVQSPGTN